VPTVVELTNEPFDVSIIDLQVRSQGGRAYKVIDSESRVFDLREDQLLEALKIGGVQPGGQINGKFVWGVLSSQMRMVYVGGDMHKSMVQKLESNKEKDVARANNVAVKPSSFTVGHVYKKRDDSLYVFVGRVRTADSKKLFAFAELPTPPHHHDDDVISGYVTNHGYKEDHEFIQRLRKEADVASRWETMTWMERCEGERYISISLMSTPKFDSDEGPGARDVADMLRANVDRKYLYLDGNRNDLATKRWLEKTGVDLDRWYATQPYAYNEVQRQANEKQRQDWVKNAFDQFKSELVWD
jgi:hypothetical protein